VRRGVSRHTSRVNPSSLAYARDTTCALTVDDRNC
jgi:hypothetical protein